jgi:hypothetical protein
MTELKKEGALLELLNLHGCKVKAIEDLTTDSVDLGNLSGELRTATLIFEDGERLECILKVTKEEMAAMSAQRGMTREAKFYSDLAPGLQAEGCANFPRSVLAIRDAKTGFQVIVMEKLNHVVQAGTVFGAHAFHNWGKDTDAMIKDGGEGYTPKAVMEHAFD